MRAKLCFRAALAAVFVLLGCKITTISDAGSGGNSGATATGTVGTSGNCTATITESSISKTLTNGKLLLAIGETAKLTDTVTVNPPGCASTAHRFASSDTNVATVDQTGLVTGKHAGTTQICDFVSANQSIFICITTTVSGGSGVTATSIAVFPPSVSIAVGSVMTPDSVKVTNSDGTVQKNVPGTYTCVSANSLLVQIVNASTCQFKAIAVGNNVVITVSATSNPSVTATLTVNVVSAGTLGVNPASFSISIGAGCVVTGNLALAINAVTNPVVTVTSGNPAIASVSGSGANWTVTGVSVGSTNLTVTVSGSNLPVNLTATVGVNVTNNSCSSGADFIDYLPHGGVVTVGTSATPVATCTFASSAPCDKEFWSSTQPECKDVNATDGFQTVSGFNFPVGPHGKIVSIASCSANISVQASLTNTTLKATYSWTG